MPICERTAMLKRTSMPPTSTTLAPFYARARWRRVWRRLRAPLLIGGMVIVALVAALLANWYLI
jgi:hypothetical protein